MTRVVGFDPGTVSIDICGLADGRLYLDHSWPTEDALAHPDSSSMLLQASRTSRPGGRPVGVWTAFGSIGSGHRRRPASGLPRPAG